MSGFGHQTLLVCRHPKHAAKSLSNSDLTSILLLLLLLVALAQVLGYAFSKLRQPKVVGEILAGVVLGPAVFGRLSGLSWITSAADRQANVLNFVYWLGKPAIVKDFEIEVIRKFLNEYEHVIAEPIGLQPDNRVKIRQGIFMDKDATVIQVKGNKVQVFIESIGYSLLALVDKSNLALSR